MKESIFKKLKRDIRGFSLVEMVCAIAILSVISTVVGGILVVASNHYNRGSNETELQQEVQFTVNRISGLLMDATDTAEYGYYAGGTMVAAENEAAALAAGAGSGTDRYLKVVTATTTYIIRFDSATNTLMYSENASAEVLLAEKIITFEADTTTFVNNRNVVIKLGVQNEGRSITSDYNITARNGVPASLVSTVTVNANINVGTDLILEPKQTYTIPVTVTGEGITDYGFDLVSISDQHADTVITADATGITITPSAAETGGSDQAIILHLKTKAKAEDGVTPLDTASINVKIRRVNSIGVTATAVSGTPAANASTAYEAGARYKVDGVVTGQNLEQAVGFYYDLDYKNPKYVQWGFVYTEGGTDYPESSTEFQNRFEIVNKVEDHSAPYVLVELKQEMPGGSKLTVTGTSKHAKGNVGGTVYNKSGNLYANVSGSVTLTSTAVAETASISAESLVVLEPNQSYTIPVNVTGAGISDYGFNVAVSDQNSGTTITTTDTSITIKPGANETGGSDEKITLTLTTKATEADGVTPLDSTTVDVKIRRVNSIDVGASVYGTAFSSGATYTFEATVAGQNLAKVEGADYDNDYKNPNFASWKVVYRDPDGKVYDETNGEFWSMFTITGRNEYIDKPYTKVMLLKDMPGGSTLTVTATSKHADGSGNKSGIWYASVSDSFTLTSNLVEEEKDEDDEDDKWEGDVIVPRPGKDINRGGYIYLDNKLMDIYGSEEGFRSALAPEYVTDEQARWVWRVREINDDGGYGDWTPYFMMQQQSVTDMKLNADESKGMLPDKAYEIQICGYIYGQSDNKIYWPHNNTFLEDMAFYGYTAGYDTEDATTTYPEFSGTFVVEKVGVVFQSNDTFGIVDGATSVGSEANPIEMAPYAQSWPAPISLKGNITGLAIGSYIGNTKLFVQVKDASGNWVTDTSNGVGIQFIPTDYNGSNEVTFDVVRLDVGKGKEIRIGFYLEGASFRKWEIGENVFNPTISSEEVNYNMYNEETGEGFIYIRTTD